MTQTGREHVTQCVKTGTRRRATHCAIEAGLVLHSHSQMKLIDFKLMIQKRNLYVANLIHCDKLFQSIHQYLPISHNMRLNTPEFSSQIPIFLNYM